MSDKYYYRDGTPIPDDEVLTNVLGKRAGNVFSRAGIITVGQLIHTIRESGLSITSDYCLFTKGPRIRGAGLKTWTAVFGHFNKIGFDWRKYVSNRIASENYLQESDESDFVKLLEITIDEKILKLIAILGDYKKLRNDINLHNNKR